LPARTAVEANQKPTCATLGLVQSTVEKKGPTQVQLNVEVPPEEIKEIKAGTMKRLSNEVKVPGFRKGKVPPTVLESRIGREQVRQEVLADALPDLYSKAVGEQKISPLGTPEINVTQFIDNEPLVFTATVDVRPELELPDYEGIEVKASPTRASESDIANRLERMRERYSTLEPVDRAAQQGDFATIDLFGFRHGEPIEGATLEDFVYEVGSARFLPKLDEELIGKRPGDIVQFNAVLPKGFLAKEEGDQEATLKVVVKEIQARKLPPLDDEFAKTASEFDTLEELKNDISDRISGHREKDADTNIRNFILQYLIAGTDVPLPKSMVDRETELRLARFIRDVGGAGHLEEYLKANNLSKEAFIETQRSGAEISCAADLILEAVAKDQGMEVTKEDLYEEIRIMAAEMNVDVDELADNIANSASLAALAGDILRRKALDYLVSSAKIIDESEPAESTNESEPAESTNESEPAESTNESVPAESTRG
jgi:trigger factor